MKTKQQIRDYLAEQKRWYKRMDGADSEFRLVEGIIEGLEFVLDGDNETKTRKEVQSVLDSLADNFLYSNYPKSANGIYASAEIIDKDTGVANWDDVVYNVLVIYGRQDDCYNESFKQYVCITDKELERAVIKNAIPKFYVNKENK